MIPVVGRAIRAVRDAQRPAAARQTAVDLSLRALDLQLRYRDPTAVDLRRVSTWCDQPQLDAQRHDLEGISSDVFTLYYLRDRVHASLSAETASDYYHDLGVLQEAVVDTTWRAPPEPATRCSWRSRPQRHLDRGRPSIPPRPA